MEKTGQGRDERTESEYLAVIAKGYVGHDGGFVRTFDFRKGKGAVWLINISTMKMRYVCSCEGEQFGFLPPGFIIAPGMIRFMESIGKR